jgi:hypothetical protein
MESRDQLDTAQVQRSTFMLWSMTVCWLIWSALFILLGASDRFADFMTGLPPMVGFVFALCMTIVPVGEIIFSILLFISGLRFLRQDRRQRGIFSIIYATVSFGILLMLGFYVVMAFLVANSPGV